MVLTWIGLLVLTILASPLTRARLALIWSMAGLFAIALRGAGRRGRSSRSTMPPLVVWLAGFGIAAIVWSFARLFVPGERPVGPKARTCAPAADRRSRTTTAHPVESARR